MLHIHRAERADRLVAALAGVLAEPSTDDPFASEVVAVPTRGVERWLAQRLSAALGTTAADRSDGVCANVRFPFPGRLVGDAVAAVTGIEQERDPWRPERAVWPLLEVVDAHLDEPWLGALRRHLLGGGEQPARRFAAARHLADLFDRYGVHRPGMIAAWRAGRDVDDRGDALPVDCAWQARLWRLLAERVGEPSPSERLDEASGRLRADRDAVDLPARLSVFGLTRLPATYLAVLHALAEARDVHLLLLHPSPVLWDRIAAAAPGGPPPPRAEDPTAAAPAHPLLRSWGRDAREMQLVIGSHGAAHRDRHLPVDARSTTLLGRLQAAVRDDQAPPGAPLDGAAVDERPLLDSRDDSLRVHACHGRGRQVEVVRDAILHLLADHPHLEPRDVVVMCPDVEAYAPLIHAAFGPVGAEVDVDDGPAPSTRPRGLRVRLADRSLRQTNPVLRVVSDLLALADQRLSATQVLELAAREPVRRRFALSDDDLDRMEGWVGAAGIRWGLDPASRRAYKLDGVAAGTWRAGLERILTGVAMDESELRLVGGVLPLDDVGSADIDLAGRLAELVDRLDRAVGRLRGRAPLTAWVDAIAASAAELTAAHPGEGWQQVQLDRLLADVADEGAGAEAPLELADVRVLFADRLRGRPTRTSFRTGHLTICTLVPMRSVPHKVVCLLGLDDGVFPRRTRPDGDDLLARAPRAGDHDPRSEDRQLLLDALLAASEHLVITYAGRDERTNAERPPAVPVGELLDVVDATVRVEGEGEGVTARARDRVVVHHPLQPFDRRVFTAGALVPARPWGFDDVALAGARAATQQRGESPAFLPQPLPPADADVIELADLEAFVAHPVKAFLRQRLGVSLTDRDDEPDDALPVDLDGLAQWAIGQRLLDARLAGVSKEACSAAERARGELPPGALGTRILRRVGAQVDAITAAATAVLGDVTATASVEVHVELPDGTVLAGTVPRVTGTCVHQLTYSRVKARQRLVTWVRLLAVTAADPGPLRRGLTIGRGWPQVAVAAIDWPDDESADRRAAALGHLQDLIELHRRGLREPLPLYCATSAAYASAAAAGRNPAAAARKAWESGWKVPGEDVEAEHRLVLGGVREFDELLDAAPCDGEDGPGWALDEPSRFGRLARRLWDGLLAVEEVDGR